MAGMEIVRESDADAFAAAKSIPNCPECNGAGIIREDVELEPVRIHCGIAFVVKTDIYGDLPDNRLRGI
jgi:hypothetical protein